MSRSYNVSNEDLFKTNTALLRNISEYYKYDEKGNRSKEVEGTKLSVTSPCTMDRFDVKLPNTYNFPVTQEDLTEAAKNMEYVMVSFEGLIATPYVRDGRVAESYKAKAATPVAILKLVSADSKGKA